ncbi:lactonase family protein [Paraburkholderia ferrariae]|uniref:YncE family protein n=1 Tax=Paraburkholderia ferrariae TaxID=386056 RepID=UPI0005A73987|nr:YncE family protein [Paraburkholderia ferrariae]
MRRKLALLALSLVCLLPRLALAQIMLVGIDTKLTFDDRGQRVYNAPGEDLVQFYDLGNPAHPELIGALPLTNSVVGPPSNLAVTPDQRLALIANSLDWQQQANGTWKPVPDDRLFVVDVRARPPRLVATVKVGSQPSGLAIDRTGTMAIVANRDGKSLSVLSIHGDAVAVTDTVPMGDTVTSVAIAPDGKSALAVKTAKHSVALLSIDNGRVTPTGYEMPVGLWPWQVTITPDGRFGLVGDTGNQATSSGNASPVAVIDLSLQPPRVVDFVTAGDSIEGLVASPRGNAALATILNGSYDAATDAWYRHKTGLAVLIGIEDGKVRRTSTVDVGAFPEGAAFSPDGRYAYTGNYASNTLSVLRVEADGKLVDTHADIALPGPPASMRVGSQ